MYRVLEEIGIEAKDTLLVLNKIDPLPAHGTRIDPATIPERDPAQRPDADGLDRLPYA